MKGFVPPITLAILWMIVYSLGLVVMLVWPFGQLGLADHGPLVPSLIATALLLPSFVVATWLLNLLARFVMLATRRVTRRSMSPRSAAVEEVVRALEPLAGELRSRLTIVQ